MGDKEEQVFSIDFWGTLYCEPNKEICLNDGDFPKTIKNLLIVIMIKLYFNYKSSHIKSNTNKYMCSELAGNYSWEKIGIFLGIKLGSRFIYFFYVFWGMGVCDFWDFWRIFGIYFVGSF